MPVASYCFLKLRSGEFIPAREISRRVGGKRRYRFAPEWAEPVLLRITERGILERDEADRFRLKPIPKRDTKGKVWAALGIAEVLKRNRQWSDKVLTAEEEDDYYEKLRNQRDAQAWSKRSSCPARTSRPPSVQTT